MPFTPSPGPATAANLLTLVVDGIEIDPSGATLNQVLSYNGTKFVPTTAASGGTLSTIIGGGNQAGNTVNLTAASGYPWLVDSDGTGNLLSLTHADTIDYFGFYKSTFVVNGRGVGVTTDGTGMNITITPFEAATLGNPQYSPPILMRSKAWNAGLAASQNGVWYTQAKATEGTPITSQLVFSSRIGGGSITPQLSITSAGEWVGPSSNSITYRSQQVDGATTAHIFDTSTAWSTGKLFSFRTNGVEKLYLSSFNGSMLFGTDGAGLFGSDSASRIQFTTGISLIQSGIGAVSLLSGVANGASAVGHIIDTSATFSTSGAKALSFRSGGTEWGFWGITSGGRKLVLNGDAGTLEIRNVSGSTIGAGIRLDTTQNAAAGRIWSLHSGGNTTITGAFILRDESSSADRLIIDTAGNVRSGSDAAVALGGSSNRWSNVFAVAVTQSGAQVFALQGAQASGVSNTTFEARATSNITTTGHKLWSWLNNTSSTVGYLEKTATGWSMTGQSGLTFSFTGNWHVCGVGSQLTAAASITPTTGIHHVTGATNISTIATTNVPTGSTVTFIADGGTINFITGGNIASAFTIAQNKSQIVTWDGTSWFPHQ